MSSSSISQEKGRPIIVHALLPAKRSHDELEPAALEEEKEKCSCKKQRKAACVDTYDLGPFRCFRIAVSKTCCCCSHPDTTREIPPNVIGEAIKRRVQDCRTRTVWKMNPTIFQRKNPLTVVRSSKEDTTSQELKDIQNNVIGEDIKPRVQDCRTPIVLKMNPTRFKAKHSLKDVMSSKQDTTSDELKDIQNAAAPSGSTADCRVKVDTRSMEDMDIEDKGLMALAAADSSTVKLYDKSGTEKLEVKAGGRAQIDGKDVEGAVDIEVRVDGIVETDDTGIGSGKDIAEVRVDGRVGIDEIRIDEGVQIYELSDEDTDFNIEENEDVSPKCKVTVEYL